MNNIAKEYAALQSHWYPANPIAAFMPFIYKFIKDEKINNIYVEDFTKGFFSKFGINVTYHLILNILEYMKKSGEATVSAGQWSFNIKYDHKHEINDAMLDKETTELIDKFTEFCGSLVSSREEACNIINSFFLRYDASLIVSEVEKINDNLDVHDYLMAEFIKEISKSNKELFDFIIKVAQGSIIKSSILSENLQTTPLADKKFFLDTKIVIRLLGYNGEYYEKEYKKLIQELNEKGAEVYISEYVYNEIIYILNGCKRYIESSDYEYEKASIALRYFRYTKKDKSYIEEAIVTFEGKLLEYNIKVDRSIITKEDYPFNEDFSAIENIIRSKYWIEDDEFSLQGRIETDVKSICQAYIKRKNNTIKLLQDAKVFFVTSNAKVIKAAMEYHESKYPKTMAPIISDTFLGLLVFSQGQRLEEYTSLKLMAFCYEAFQPTKPQREKFIQIAVECEKNGKINSNQLFLLKHYNLIDDVLVNKLRANDFIINDDCVLDILGQIEANYVRDVTLSYERKESSLKKSHEKELDLILEKASLDIDKEREKNERIANVYIEKELIKYKKKLSIAYYSLIGLLFLGSAFLAVISFPLGFHWVIQLLFIFFSVVILLFTIVPFTKKDILLFSFLNNLYKNKRKNLETEYLKEIQDRIKEQ